MSYPNHHFTSTNARKAAAMSKPAMWKTPPRREYKPKVMDPGQVAVWTREIPGRWTGEQWGEGEWLPGFTEEAIGEIWANGPQPSTWWVIPDGSREPVIVKRAGKRDGFGHGGEGALYQPHTYPAGHWSRMIRAAENVRRSGGVFAVVEEERTGWTGGQYGNRVQEKVLRWHCDPQCPDVTGKPRDDGRGYATYRQCPHVGPWTVNTVVDVIIGRIDLHGPAPFCPRCVMLEAEPARELVTA